MSKYNKIIDSFSLKGSLNPKIWSNPTDPKKSKMVPKVREGLIKIADEFIEFIGVDIFIEDIVLTGSLSNFNWSEFSDFDLHIILNMEEYGDNSIIYKEFFNLKKQIFNQNRDIKIFGYDVELYPQDSEEQHLSTGVYSIMNDEWINVPVKFKTNIDKTVLTKKIKSWVDKIEDLLDAPNNIKTKKSIEKLRDKIKTYRKLGLESDGELSYENLVFKFLRRSGHIERIFDEINKMADKELSIEGKRED